MAAGQSGKPRIGAIIQARMRSTRLPGKILMPLPFDKGKPLLWWSIQGARRSELVDEVVLASSVNPENDPLVVFANQMDTLLYRGSEDDVLSRFINVGRDRNFDTIVRLTGDNPIVDSAILTRVIQHHLSKENDYTFTTGLPTGMNFEVIESKVLLSLETISLSNEDREHVTLYVKNSSVYKTEKYALFPTENWSDLRITIDYPTDYALLSIIMGTLRSDEFPDMKLIIKLKNEAPWLFGINESNFQRKQFTSVKEEINWASKFLEQNDLKEAAKILARHS